MMLRVAKALPFRMKHDGRHQHMQHPGRAVRGVRKIQGGPVVVRGAVSMERVFQHEDDRKQNGGCTPGSNVALADDELALGKGLDGHPCVQTAKRIVFERRQERKLLPMRMMQHRWRASQVKPRPELHFAAAQHLLSELGTTSVAAKWAANRFLLRHFRFYYHCSRCLLRKKVFPSEPLQLFFGSSKRPRPQPSFFFYW